MFGLIKGVRETLRAQPERFLDKGNQVATTMTAASLVNAYAGQKGMKLLSDTTTDQGAKSHCTMRLTDETGRTKMYRTGVSVDPKAAKQVAAAEMLKIILEVDAGAERHFLEKAREDARRIREGTTRPSKPQAPAAQAPYYHHHAPPPPPAAAPAVDHSGRPAVAFTGTNLSSLLTTLQGQQQPVAAAPQPQPVPQAFDPGALRQLHQSLSMPPQQAAAAPAPQLVRQDSIHDDFRRRKVEVPPGHRLLRHEQLPSPRDPRAGIIYERDLIDRLRAAGAGAPL